MNTDSLLSPLIRRSRLTGVLFVVLAGLIWGTAQLIPQTQKTTIYFTVKPLEATQPSLDTIESASKVAEMIAGWVKDPGFRESVASEAEVVIPNFKRKITARKQNRLNVFVSLKLHAANWPHSEKITDTLITHISDQFYDWAESNSFPAEITAPSVSQEQRAFPLSWLIIAMLIIAGFGSVGLVYLQEALTGRVSFAEQLEDLFIESPLLFIDQPLGKHNGKLLEQFILTFDSPRLIGTFAEARKYFSLAPIDAVDEEVDTPVLLVKLGETKMRDLKNLGALFGDEIGIIIFER